MLNEFDQLMQQAERNGTPFQCLVRKNNGTYQASVRSRYATGKHDAFTVGHGTSATTALAGALRAVEEEDPLS